jgi:hypothetical protein
MGFSSWSVGGYMGDRLLERAGAAIGGGLVPVLARSVILTRNLSAMPDGIAMAGW